MDIVRGAPCPCGSGRKHKKCCLPAESAPGAALDVDASLRRKIMNFVQGLDHTGKLLVQAREQWGAEIAGAPAEKEDRFLDFMDYFVHDFRFPPQARLAAGKAEAIDAADPRVRLQVAANALMERRLLAAAARRPDAAWRRSLSNYAPNGASE